MIRTRLQLINDGMSPHQLTRLVAAGDLVKVASGTFVAVGDLPPWPDERHRLSVVAMARRCGLVVSHVSAAVLHGLPVPGADLSRVHFTRPGVGGGLHGESRVVHAGALPPRWRTRLDGIAVTHPARTVVDVARTQSLGTAVAVADAALHAGLCTYEELAQVVDESERTRGVHKARAAAELWDDRAESPGESLMRVALNQLGFPRSELQVTILDERGRFVGRADGGILDKGVLWEFDGAVKYGPDGGADALVAEKRREEGFAGLGWQVVRAVSHDVRDPGELEHRMRRALARAERPGWAPPLGAFRLMSRRT